MKGDFCRMCGSKKLRKEKREIFLSSQNKTVRGVGVWVCANCGEEFLDEASREKLYEAARVRQRREALTA